MVILQFNKLIRNKWIWGVFAVIVGGAFAFDFLIDDWKNDNRSAKDDAVAGLLAGEKVPSAEYQSIQEEIRGIGRNRDWKSEQNEVNRRAWENYAALQVADKAGLTATDEEVMAEIRRQGAFQQNGAFSFRLYQLVLRDNSLTPERYEASVKRSLTLQRLAQHVLGSAVWASPMELDQAVSDMTDVFTVKVASFAQDNAAAEAVALDDVGLKKWYDDNVKNLEIPERVKIRYAAFDTTKPEILAAQKVTDDDLHDRYDATIEKYTSTDTNGVETVKSFEEVKGEIEADLRKTLALEDVQRNLNQRAYAVKAAVGSSRLDEIAKECGVEVKVSDWFSTDGEYQEGFMKRAYQIIPGASGLVEAVAELDPENEDLRYGIVSSDKTVWLIEKAEASAKHTPSFEEAKDAIRPRALKSAKADAFKSSVDALIAAGTEAILASPNQTNLAFKATVSTNLTFSVADLKPGEIPDQNAVARAAAKLAKGGVSEFTSTGTGRAIVVICEERVEGDEGKKMVLKSTIQGDVTALAAGQIPAAWQKWNLERLGFETTESSSVDAAEVEE